METTSALEATVRARGLPRHLGLIMDGNGRWAESQGRPRLDGHREGSNSVREVTRCCRRLGVAALTLYAFSSQNWSRPPDEVAGLMDLLREYLLSERAEILDHHIRLNAIGELDKLPKYVREPLEEIRAASAQNTGMVLTLALSYGGREEIVNAAKALAAQLVSGHITAAQMTEKTFEAELSTANLPPVDLVVRTSGEHRMSNFLLWQSAYAELVFSETLWPDFRAEQLLACLQEYQARERRFGLTSAQVRGVSP
jgi:undecaprenyl diphosphate synthase